MSASVSTRRSASSGEPACTVDSEPSWPLDIALSMSSASRAAHLADDDAVRAHAQRVAHEAPHGHLAAALQRGRPRLEAHDVGVAQAQLGGVLDGDDPLAVADELRQRVERRRLARAGAAADEHVAARAHGARAAGRAAAPPTCRWRRGRRGRSRAAGSGGSSAPGRRARAARRRRSPASRRAAARRTAARPRRRGGRAARGSARSRGAGRPRRRSDTPVGSIRPPRSTHTWPGPLTITSSTDGSPSSGSSGPSPNERSAMRAASAGARVVVEQAGLAVDERADALVQVAVAAVAAGLGEQPVAQRAGEARRGRRRRRGRKRSIPQRARRAKFAPRRSGSDVSLSAAQRSSRRPPSRRRARRRHRGRRSVAVSEGSSPGAPAR